MQVEFLREFVVLTQYMNITKAAEALHISQSGLSKHLRQLENDLGFPLLVHSSRKVQLTHEGNLFLGRLAPFLDSFDMLVDDCVASYERKRRNVTIQEAPFFDSACLFVYRAIEKCKTVFPHLAFSFGQIHGGSTEKALSNGEVDFAFAYSADKIESGGGVHSIFIKQVPLYVWVNEGSPLAARSFLTVGDLDGVAIMQPSDAFSPLCEVIKSLFQKEGLRPQFFLASYSFKVEYLFSSPSDSVYIVPDVADYDANMRARTSMVFKPLQGAMANVYLIMKGGKDSDKLKCIADFFRDEFNEMNA